jgi:hypothetical protein
MRASAKRRYTEGQPDGTLTDSVPLSRLHQAAVLAKVGPSVRGSTCAHSRTSGAPTLALPVNFMARSSIIAM